MASGFNGQSFTFNGYLPVEPNERTRKIRQLEQRIYQENQTQIFIETPYRNHKMIEELVRTCRPALAYVLLATSVARTRRYTLAQWHNGKKHNTIIKKACNIPII